MAQLRLAYAGGGAAAFTTTTNTGLLNNVFHLLGGVVPPLADVIESLRAALIGDSLTVEERLAIAEAIGEDI